MKHTDLGLSYKAEYVAKLEAEIAELREQVRQLTEDNDNLADENDTYRDEAAQAEAERDYCDNKWSEISEPASVVVEAPWHSAEVLDVTVQQFGARMVLDVDLSPGEALLRFRRGQRLTVSGADSREFVALEQAI